MTLNINWGYNRSYFTKSNIFFLGNDFEFNLKKVIANDRPTKEFLTYIHPLKFTIPQYNFSLNIEKEKIQLSLGIDHMKYVVKKYQTVTCNGYINNNNIKYDGNYNDNDIIINDDFLQLEHSDGLNYIFLSLDKKKEMNKFIDLLYGFGIGAITPVTRAKFLQYKKYDKLNLAGYGVNLKNAFKMNLTKKLFILLETKLGFINMPNIKISSEIRNKVKQKFFFISPNIKLGKSF